MVETIREPVPGTVAPSQSARAWLEELFRLDSTLHSTHSRQFRVLAIDISPSPSTELTARVLLTSRGRDANGAMALVESEHELTGNILDGRQLSSHAWLSRWVMLREIQRTSPQPLFAEVTAAWQLDRLSPPDNWSLTPAEVLQYRFQMAASDFDNDGHIDLAVAALGSPPLLLHGRSTTGFHDVARQTGLVVEGRHDTLNNFAAAWIDYDNDDWPDLLLGNRLYHNQKGKSFVDVTLASGLGFLPECMGCLVTDYDCDGRLDLYVLYQKPLSSDPRGREQWVDETGSGLENQLWRNEGRGKFRNVTRRAKAGGGRRHTHAAAWFFLDDDHLPDLYLANDFGRNIVLKNQPGGFFVDVSQQSGANGFATSMGVAAGDLDNDGSTDIYVSNMYSKMGRRIIGQVGEDDYPPGVFHQIQGSCAGNRLYRSTSQQTFSEISQAAGVNAVGWAYAPVLADFDTDGRLDIYATTGFLSFDRRKPDG